MDWGWFLFSLQGRISRRQYWLNFLLPVFALSVVIALVSESFGGTRSGQTQVDWLVILWSLAVIWPGIATQVKRWHDRDKSGWWYLIAFVPIIGSLWAFIETGFLPGTEGDNRYGPDPKTADLAEARR